MKGKIDRASPILKPVSAKFRSLSQVPGSILRSLINCSTSKLSIAAAQTKAPLIHPASADQC
ncbi:hypothetical protein [Bradyrhizobium sp. 193]|uniref:hypothetical protein n=1 Tax=Bradyrhizobium sp. 193 TaxID=2782661 RepID=UPI001FF8DDF5|nr:hypothetical protein [Bradyrhizobium sp. 193]